MEKILFDRIGNNAFQCNACLRNCLVTDINNGFCGNRGLNKEVKININAIDSSSRLKDKPILFLKDGKGNLVDSNTSTISVGGNYCNLNCLECPNPSMSHPKESSTVQYHSADYLINLAKNLKIKYIAMTYNEFIPFPETVLDITTKATKEEISTILVTNTTFTKEFIEMFYKNGGKIARLDLKASIKSGNKFYKEYCDFEIKENGDTITMKKILESIKYAKSLGMHIELQTAITPFGYVPSNFPCVNEFKKTALWIKENLGEETPWHLTLLRTKEKIDLESNFSRIKHWSFLAKSFGLKNVIFIEKMCDCREKELFK